MTSEPDQECTQVILSIDGFKSIAPAKIPSASATASLIRSKRTGSRPRSPRPSACRITQVPNTELQRLLRCATGCAKFPDSLPTLKGTTDCSSTRREKGLKVQIHFPPHFSLRVCGHCRESIE